MLAFWVARVSDLLKSTKSALVESRMGAVAWGLWPTPRFPSPLVKPGVPISGTRLSDWLHRKAHAGRPLSAGVGRRHLGTTGGSASAFELSRPARASLCYGPSDRSAAQGRLRRRRARC